MKYSSKHSHGTNPYEKNCGSSMPPIQLFNEKSWIQWFGFSFQCFFNYISLESIFIDCQNRIFSLIMFPFQTLKLYTKPHKQCGARVWSSISMEMDFMNYNRNILGNQYYHAKMMPSPLLWWIVRFFEWRNENGNQRYKMASIANC